MKTFKLTIISIILIASTIEIVDAQTKVKKDKLSILDYYKLIPSYELDFEKADAKQKTLDIKNGYLELDIKKGRMKAELALFRKGNGKAIIVLFTQNNDIENIFSPNSIKAFELSEFSLNGENELDDVTFEVLPRLSSRENLALFNQKRKKKKFTAESITMFYKIPRKGKIIIVTANNMGEEGEFEDGVKLYELHLQNDKFVIVGK